MKKSILALMCMAAVAMFTACIGNTNKKNADDGTTETKTETVKKSGSDRLNDSALGSHAPRPKSGKVKQTSTYEKQKQVQASMEWTKDDAKAYIDQLQAEGFTTSDNIESFYNGFGKASALVEFQKDNLKISLNPTFIILEEVKKK